MLYQNEETDPLVVGTNNETPREVKNRKDCRFLGGLAAMLLMAMAFLANQSSGSASLIRWAEWEPNRLYVTINGNLRSNAEGTYKASTDTFNSQPIYDRDDGGFIAFMNPDKSWCFTHSVYRDAFVNSGGGRGCLDRSFNRSPVFWQARFPGQTDGSTPAPDQPDPAGTKLTSMGKYIASTDTYNGEPIWDRADKEFFAVRNSDGYWHIEKDNGFDRKDLNGKSGLMNGYLSRNSITKCDTFREATFIGQFVVLEGPLPQGLGGHFRPTTDTFNGKPIWVRSDKQLLAFQDQDGKWALSGYQYLSAIVSKANGGMGNLLKALDKSESFTDAWFPGQSNRYPR